MQEINPAGPEHKTPADKPAAIHNSSEVMAELRLQRELLKQNNDMLRSMKRSLRAAALFSSVRTLIWLIPLAIGLVYLPPLLKKASESWRAVQEASSPTGLPQGLDLQSLQDILQRSGLLER